MKSPTYLLYIVISLLFSGTVTLANEITLDKDNFIVHWKAPGKGSWTCSAEESFAKVPVLGRGRSQLEASTNAKNACGKHHNNDFFCSVKSCEKDKAPGSEQVSINFSITRNNGFIQIITNSKSNHECVMKGFGGKKHYYAKAPTKTEAEAIAKMICADDEGKSAGKEPSGFFCSLEKCNILRDNATNGNLTIDNGSVSGSIGTFGSILDGLFGKKKEVKNSSPNGNQSTEGTTAE